MKKFIIINYGFEKPTPEIMERWMSWFGSLTDRIADPGTPFGMGMEITHEDDHPLSPMTGGASGYTIIHAENLEEAVAVAKAAPFIDSMRVYECMPAKEMD